MPVPAWTEAPIRFLEHWWFVSPHRSVHANALVSTPAAEAALASDDHHPLLVSAAFGTRLLTTYPRAHRVRVGRYLSLEQLTLERKDDYTPPG